MLTLTKKANFLGAQNLYGCQARGIKLAHRLLPNGANFMQRLHGFMDGRKGITAIFFFILNHLFKLSICNQDTQLGVRKRQHMLRHFLELILLVGPDISEFALWESIHKKAFFAFAKKNNAAVSLGLTFTWTGNPLLDDATAKVFITLAESRFW